jgi:hypothetical protein
VKTVQKIPIILIFFSLLITSCSKDKTYSVEIKDGVRHVHNIKPKFDHPIARLEFVRQIGELEPEDEKYMFQEPLSIDRDENGCLYILDTKACLIKKFDQNGQYISEFGRQGQGPGEFEYPQKISIGGEGKIMVTTMGAVLHIFDLSGTFIKRLQLNQYQGIFMQMMKSGTLVGYSMEFRGENSKDNKILKIYDLEGNVLHEFGEPLILDKIRGSWSANFPSIVLDKKDNIFVTFTHQNRIEKYSHTGELLIKIDRELPFHLNYGYKKDSINIGEVVREIDSVDFPYVSRGVGVDHQGRIWVMSVEKEIADDIKPEEISFQEYFEFEIYSQEGILLSKVSLPDKLERFDNWTMKDDTIYFVDPFGECCIHEYRIVDY